jgi:hypothetical protein
MNFHFTEAAGANVDLKLLHEVSRDSSACPIHDRPVTHDGSMVLLYIW